MTNPQPALDVVGNNFELLELIGRGGMSEVYLANDILRGRQCAVKLVRADLQEVALGEVKSLRKVRHPNVVALYEAGRHLDRYFIAMEQLRGDTLRTAIATRGAFRPNEANDLLEQVAWALEAIHSCGIIHCDLKPENIFRHRLENDELTVKVLDFGVAKLRGRSETALLAGTPEYMAPEQFLTSEELCPGTDIFAYGLLTYFLLTGRSYWKAANNARRSNSLILNEIRVALRSGPLLRLSQRLAEDSIAISLPSEAWEPFDTWLSCCLALSPANRFRTINAAYADLRRILRKQLSLGSLRSLSGSEPPDTRPNSVTTALDDFVLRVTAEITTRIPEALAAMQETIAATEVPSGAPAPPAAAPVVALGAAVQTATALSSASTTQRSATPPPPPAQSPVPPAAAARPRDPTRAVLRTLPSRAPWKARRLVKAIATLLIWIGLGFLLYVFNHTGVH